MANTFLIDHLFKNTIFKKTKTQKKTNIKFLQKEVRNFQYSGAQNDETANYCGLFT